MSNTLAAVDFRMSAPALTPEVIVDRGVTVVALGAGFESIDEQALDKGLRDALLAIADEADPPLVVLDLSHTTFFGSSFIEILFRMWNRLHAQQNGRFAICGLTSYCQEVLKIAHLDTLWPLYADRAAALKALAGDIA